MSTVSLRNDATKYIMERIHHGDILPGEILTETNVCDLLNISRTPAREALIELTANGVLEKVPRKGYRIKELDQKRKIDSYVVLGVLDALAAKLSMPNIEEKDILRMKEIIDLMDIAIKYKNYSSYVDLQEKFHHVYIDKCDNLQLVTMLADLKASIYRYTYYSDNIDKLFELSQDMNDEHRQITELFEKRDAEGLEDFLINTHWITKHMDMI